MAKLEITGMDGYIERLDMLSGLTEDVAKKAVHEAAGIVADEVRSSIGALPKERYRMLKSGEVFRGVTDTQRSDLLGSMGVTPIEQRDGVWNAKIGFDGYGSKPTKKYPKGLPNQLLARAIESGSSVRVKMPFVRPSVNRVKLAAEKAMQDVAEGEIKKIMNSGG